MTNRIEELTQELELSANTLFNASSQLFDQLDIDLTGHPAKAKRIHQHPVYVTASNMAQCAVLQMVTSHFLSSMHADGIISDIDIAIQNHATPFSANTRDIQSRSSILFDEDMRFNNRVQCQDMLHFNMDRASSLHLLIRDDISDESDLLADRAAAFCTAQNMLTHIYNVMDDEALYVREHGAMYDVAQILHASFNLPGHGTNPATITSSFEVLEDFFSFHDFGSMLTDGDIVLPNDAYSQQVGRWASGLFVPFQTEKITPAHRFMPPGLN